MRKLVIIEVLALVGPAVVVWLIGLILVPIQLVALIVEPPAREGALFVLASVAAGGCGIVAIGDLTRKVLRPGIPTLSTPWLSALGVIGSLPLIYLAIGSEFPGPIVYLLPLAAAAHLVYLAREDLFTQSEEK